MYYVYILKCRDNTLYTGYTNNIKDRVQTHNSGKGAKYTRGRLPVELKYFEEFEDKGEALKREHEIKKLSREDKILLIQEGKS
jgi:putative endonuclease